MADVKLTSLDKVRTCRMGDHVVTLLELAYDAMHQMQRLQVGCLMGDTFVADDPDTMVVLQWHGHKVVTATLTDGNPVGAVLVSAYHDNADAALRDVLSKAVRDLPAGPVDCGDLPAGPVGR